MKTHEQILEARDAIWRLMIEEQEEARRRHKNANRELQRECGEVGHIFGPASPVITLGAGVAYPLMCAICEARKP